MPVSKLGLVVLAALVLALASSQNPAHAQSSRSSMMRKLGSAVGGMLRDVAVGVAVEAVTSTVSARTASASQSPAAEKEPTTGSAQSPAPPPSSTPTLVSPFLVTFSIPWSSFDPDTGSASSGQFNHVAVLLVSGQQGFMRVFVSDPFGNQIVQIVDEDVVVQVGLGNTMTVQTTAVRVVAGDSSYAPDNFFMTRTLGNRLQGVVRDANGQVPLNAFQGNNFLL